MSSVALWYPWAREKRRQITRDRTRTCWSRTKVCWVFDEEEECLTSVDKLTLHAFSQLWPRKSAGCTDEKNIICPVIAFGCSTVHGLHSHCKVSCVKIVWNESDWTWQWFLLHLYLFLVPRQLQQCLWCRGLSCKDVCPKNNIFLRGNKRTSFQ